MREKVKFEPNVKIEPDIFRNNAISTLKRTHKETNQQPVAKRQITQWPCDEPHSPKTQEEEEFEQMSQSLSRVDMDREMSSPSSPNPTPLAVGNLLPFIPELTPDQQGQVPLEESPRSSLEPEAPSSPPKVRKITDFFSAGHFDPNRFFTPPEPPVEKHAEVKIERPSTAATTQPPKPAAPPKKKNPPPVTSNKRKAATSKRLIKPDPEEMADDMMSEEGGEASNTEEAQNPRTTSKIVTDHDEERFVRLSPPAAPETNLSLSQIKKLLENIKNGLEPDLFDPKYCCRACPKPFDKQKTFFNHINSKHSVSIEERKFIMLNYGPKPNITDPSLFCTHCQKQYENKDRFQHHNELHHGAEKVKLGRVAHKRKKGAETATTEFDLEQDEMEEQERLDTMEQSEKKNKEATLKDLENHRNLGFCQAAILKHTGPPPDINNPDFHCSVCNITYSNRASYHVHLRGIHKMDFPFALSTEKVRKAYKGPLPDIHHPKNYCCVCDIFYSQKLVYTYHLRNVHNMDIPFDKSPGIRIAVDDITDETRKPDMTDPDYFCVYCNRGYTQRSSYSIHLTKMHFMDIPQRRPGAMKPRPPLEPGISPDVLDPNHYCCVCDVKFAHANSYRIHIKKYHGLGDALEAITKTNRSKRSNYYLDREITNAGYHEKRAKSSQKTLDFKPFKS